MLSCSFLVLQHGLVCSSAFGPSPKPPGGGSSADILNRLGPKQVVISVADAGRVPACFQLPNAYFYFSNPS
ncbi:hypothetical protein EJ04DRAFT_354516 [Polyplosphaeria fusca]|uniref:Secreted protein n=1 Tax=Polyplosphaeria fusca TaxID=682080 RepID=A0A9P4R9A3_9PLEO|nr:hypothetical protein EJ04DRAFT_354516 [Polyplosphaeria fusca]